MTEPVSLNIKSGTLQFQAQVNGMATTAGEVVPGTMVSLDGMDGKVGCLVEAKHLPFLRPGVQVLVTFVVTQILPVDSAAPKSSLILPGVRAN